MRRSQKPLEAWTEGTVNRAAEHIQICYGEARNAVALVAPRSNKGFTVQFMLRPAPENPRTSRILSEVRGELAFYLLHGIGPDSWLFARYHCETPANHRSLVHWSWHPKATQLSHSQGKRV